MSDSLIPWAGPGALLPESGKRGLARIRDAIPVPPEGHAVRKLGSGFMFLAGTFAIAMFLFTANKSPARSTPTARPALSEKSGPTIAPANLGGTNYLALAAEMASIKPFDPSDYAAPFIFSRDGVDRMKAADCLATAAFYEAGDDMSGQRSVIQVVLNRVRHPSFPKSICGVVFQGSERSTGCQFSFTCDGSMQRRFPSKAQWARARLLSERALSGAVDDSVRQATHFHADYVSPWWRTALQEVGRVGAHIFYQWPGVQGKLAHHSSRTEAEVAPFDLIAGAAASPRMEAERIEPGAEISGAALAAAHAPMGGVSPTGALSTQPVDSYPNRKVVQLSSSVQTGRWAIESMKMCVGKVDCRVIGFATSWEAEANRARPASEMDRPLFLFARDSVSGMDLALWDCSRVQRVSTKECLPQNQSELAQLLRSR